MSEHEGMMPDEAHARDCEKAVALIKSIERLSDELGYDRHILHIACNIILCSASRRRELGPVKVPQ